MKILVNQNIRRLFIGILFCVTVFIVIGAVLIQLSPSRAALYLFLLALCIMLIIVLLCIDYFKVQNALLENATAEITDYFSGNQDARITCDDEGELYCLFHAVNNLVAVLNARAESEQK